MTVHLLDANVVIALAMPAHVHHERCDKWLAGVDQFATCPITQGAVVRFLVRSGLPVSEARRWLTELSARPDHSFWPDDLPYTQVDLRDVTGHRQVTDAYLRALALSREGLVATLDEAMTRLPGAILVPELPAG